ncbi:MULTISPECIES: LuxR C-terminal-related transcriptional regulator [unclassified Isoptericola]|uniref:LuxR C-terminal-related transcriptional regulator n=1 Tax=unclassified Isoptericola TaxID=2623355 RepID=UPI0036501EB2
MAAVGTRRAPEDRARRLDASGPLRARTAVPPPSPGAVARPRVDRLLADTGQRRLTLVSAGPGWGKTTTVAAWARGPGATQVAWLTLEAADRAPTAFWADVLVALRRSGAVPAGHPLRAISVPSRLSPDLVRRILLAVDLLPEPAVLVLDDFHLAGPKVLETVDDLLRYPLPLHLVILTRFDPALSLQRLRAQGEVTELGAGDLALDPTETGSLAAVAGQALGAEDVDRLLAETGGWPVGVRLHLDASDDPVRRDRAQRSAAEFLLAEVLQRLDPTARAFLLRTSVTPTLCADLAAVLAPGAPAPRLLRELAASNGFVARVDAEGSWFRYHPLLREMLQQELRLEDPAASAEAHRAAARWFARHGEAVRALDHAVASADWALVGDVFVDVAAAQLVGPRRQAVVDALDRVPYASLTPTVALHLCTATLALVDGRPDGALHHLGRARKLLGDPAQEPGAAVLLEDLEATAARAVGDVGRLYRAAGAALAAADRVPLPFPALATYRSLARAHHEAGRAWCAVPRRDGVAGPAGLPDTPEDDRQAAALVTLGAHAARALQDVADGRLTGGTDRARAVVDRASARGWVGHVQTAPALAALAWVALQRAEETRAGTLLAQARAATSGLPDPAPQAAVHLLESLLAARQSDARRARRELAAAAEPTAPHPVPPLLADLRARAATDAALAAGVVPGTLGGTAAGGAVVRPTPVARVCRARLLLAAGRSGEALRAVHGLAAADPAEADDLTRVEAALVEATVLVRTGARHAEPAVERALRAAAPEVLVAPFLTVAGATLRPVVAAAVAGRDDPLAERLRGVLPDTGAGGPPAPLEPLTARELAVLATLPTMASNVEIAEELFVSVNTVKAHLKALYRKLGVGSRRDAVRQGRRLGLLP